MTSQQLKKFFIDQGLDPYDLVDIKRKLRVIQMDNAWHFINTRDDDVNIIMEINYDDDNSLGGGYIKLKERVRDFYRISYKTFDVIQGMIFATGEIAPSVKGTGIIEDIVGHYHSKLDAELILK